jgi:CRP/FNR family transcriptional regulator, dissimilatory nitrate respiration regulator
MDEKARVLLGAPLCADLTLPQVKKLAAISAFKDFAAGELLFGEGDPARGLYVLSTGRVKVSKLSAAGKEQILNIFGSGQTVGEAAMFAGGRFPAGALALESVRALWLGRDRLLKLMAREPRLAMGMMSVLTRRLHHFAQMVDELSLHDVPMRLARYLLEHASAREPGMVFLELKKSDLAQRLGTVPETLSRALAKLTRLQLIRKHGAGLRILDQARLTSFAQEGK